MARGGLARIGRPKHAAKPGVGDHPLAVPEVDKFGPREQGGVGQGRKCRLLLGGVASQDDNAWPPLPSAGDDRPQTRPSIRFTPELRIPRPP
jgi:hypothetical protein